MPKHKLLASFPMSICMVYGVGESFGSGSEGFLSTQRAVVEGLQEVAARPARTQRAPS